MIRSRSLLLSSFIQRISNPLSRSIVNATTMKTQQFSSTKPTENANQPTAPSSPTATDAAVAAPNLLSTDKKSMKNEKSQPTNDTSEELDENDKFTDKIPTSPPNSPYDDEPEEVSGPTSKVIRYTFQALLVGIVLYIYSNVKVERIEIPNRIESHRLRILESRKQQEKLDAQTAEQKKIKQLEQDKQTTNSKIQ